MDVPKGTLVEVDVEESFVRKSVGLQNRFVLKEDPIVHNFLGFDHVLVHSAYLPSVQFDFSPLASSSSMTVVCMDVSREKVKLSVIFKVIFASCKISPFMTRNRSLSTFYYFFYLQELYPIEHELYELLFPLAPENRYSMVSDPDKLTLMKSCQVQLHVLFTRVCERFKKDF